MKSVRLGLFALAALLAGTAAALGYSTTTTADTNTHSGPGPRYDVIGAIAVNTPVEVGNCENNYCEIAGYGWINQKYLQVKPNSPQPPQPPAPQPPAPQPPQPEPPTPPNPWPPIFPWPQPEPPQPPQPQPPRPPQPDPEPPIYEQAGACFYSEPNFRGAAVCLDEGETYNRLNNWNNRIRSVELYGGARVDMCTEANFYGSCTTLRNDAARLPYQLDRSVTSLEIY